MREKDIKESINSPLLASRHKPKDFIVYKVNGFWNVKFTYLDKNECELSLRKREKNADVVTKVFKSIDTVEACLSDIGVNEFKVITNI